MYNVLSTTDNFVGDLNKHLLQNLLLKALAEPFNYQVESLHFGSGEWVGIHSNRSNASDLHLSTLPPPPPPTHTHTFLRLNR